MSAPTHRFPASDFHASVRAAVLAYIAAHPGADFEAIRSDLAAKCGGERYLSAAVKTLARREAIQLVDGRRWRLAERSAA